MDISIVVPVFDEVGNIEHVYEGAKATLDSMRVVYEIIFVNDGSMDGSGQVLDRLAARDSRVKVAHLRRNYGQTAALMCAIQYSSGDVIVPMDCDGQNDPSDIPLLVNRLNDGFDVVSGWRKKRKDTMITRRLPSIVANWLISAIMGVKLHDYGCSLKAYRRSVLEDIRLYGDMHRFLPVYAAWEGAKVTELVVHHHARKFGQSKYGLNRIFRVLLDLVILYFLGHALDRPIQFFGKFGIVLGGMSIVTFCFALWLRIFEQISLIQTPLPLLAAAMALASAIFVLMGVLAEIQARTYYESQGRTFYKVQKTLNLDAPQGTKLRRDP